MVHLDIVVMLLTITSNELSGILGIHDGHESDLSTW